jgi:hypothetical protein
MWWKRDVRTEYEKRHEDQRFGYCNNEKKFIYGDNKTIYLDNDDGEVKVRLEPDDALCYCDQESYHAYFTTGQNFGCIHWEAAG